MPKEARKQTKGLPSNIPKGIAKAVTKGKVVSQKEYDETVMKKMEEFREMNQGRGGRGGMEIRINH